MIDNNDNKDAPQYRLMVLLDQELPECNRINKVDELVEKFCTNHGTSKNSRKRMQKSLFTVPRSRLDLLPYYSRIAAIFDRVFPDIAEPLVIAVCVDVLNDRRAYPIGDSPTAWAASSMSGHV